MMANARYITKATHPILRKAGAQSNSVLTAIRMPGARLMVRRGRRALNARKDLIHAISRFAERAMKNITREKVLILWTVVIEIEVKIVIRI